jgi:hypothetical protein
MIKPLLLALALATVLGLGMITLLNGAGIMSVDRLRYMSDPQLVTVTGKLLDVQVNSTTVILTLAGDSGFKVTAVVNRTMVEALYGPVTRSSFDQSVVVSGVYYPGINVINVEAILRGCHAAYAQPSANT